MDYKLEIKDGFKMQDASGNAEIKKPVLNEYRVIAKAGIFKNGKHYQQGETVKMVTKSAQSFIKAKEIDYIEGYTYKGVVIDN